MTTQLDLPVQTETPLFLIRPDHPNVAWLVQVLGEADWLTAAEICGVAEKLVNEQNRRWVRALADASGGRVAGGQRGYKLVQRMTAEEYNHWRNWMTSQADAMRRRVVEADKIFYGNKPV